MALPPRSNDAAFFREVDEEVRRDRLTGLWRRWGRVVLAAVAGLLVLLALGLWWQAHRRALAARDGEALTGLLAAAEANRVKPGDARLAALAASPRPGYRALGQLLGGDLAGGADPAEAARRFRAVADDVALPQPLRDLALVRATTLDFDRLPPAAVVAALAPLAQPGGPWFGSAGELTAAAQLKQGRRDLAGRMFAAVARDARTPPSLRARAASMAGSLGQEVGTPPAAVPFKD